MFRKGDIVLVTSAKNIFAGKLGVVKRVASNKRRAIVEMDNIRKDVWFKIEDLIKLTKNQEIKLRDVLKES